jgi:hypothetical protein
VVFLISFDFSLMSTFLSLSLTFCEISLLDFYEFFADLTLFEAFDLCDFYELFLELILISLPFLDD